MNWYFFDSSALIKVYAPERGSERVRSIYKSARLKQPTARIFLCDLALAETAHALGRKPREQGSGISMAAARRYLDQLTSETSSSPGPYLVVNASTVMRDAAELALELGLRGADAVQLAAALAAKAITPGEELTLVAGDQQLLRVAQTEGIKVLDVA